VRGKAQNLQVSDLNGGNLEVTVRELAEGRNDIHPHEFLKHTPLQINMARYNML
jgi:hypothetical protein